MISETSSSPHPRVPNGKIIRGVVSLPANTVNLMIYLTNEIFSLGVDVRRERQRAFCYRFECELIRTLFKGRRTGEEFEE